MPRPEAPLGDDDSVVTRFAAGLRQLRKSAASPPYRQLAREAHYSATTLADAAAGRRFPSLAVTLAYVRACGGDPAEWEERWHAAAAEALREAEAADSRPVADERCPYVGLAAFGPEDAEWFFGREQLTKDLEQRVRERRFVAVFGASGAGKSSLLRAGLLPRMSGGPRTAGHTVLLTPGPHPVEECAVRLAALGAGSATALREELERAPRALHLTVLQLLADQPADADLLLVVDQFEEVFTLCADRRERDRFITSLLTAAGAPNSRTRVVIGVRADFYARCSEHPELIEGLRDAQLLVGPMTTDELRLAITGPAVRAGCTVEGALLASVVGDAAGQANVLPLVSHALRETWRRRRGNALTAAGYLATGGIRQSLAQTAEAVYTGLTAHQALLAQGVFLRLIALGEGTEPTKRRVPLAEFDSDDADTRAMLDALAAARLLTLDTETVEITHEALLTAWPRLHDWIAEDRAGLLLHQQLNEAAAAWEREHHDSGTLYRGSRLATAAEWAVRRHAVPISDRVHAFLAASLRHRSRINRVRRTAVALLAVLAVLATGTAVLAVQQRSTARGERDRAVAEQALAQAGQTRDTDLSLAADLDLASYRTRSSPEASTDLLDTQNTPLSTPLSGHTEAVYAVAFSPDGHTLATGAGDDTIRLWSLADPARPKQLGPPLRGHTDWVYWLQFSPDGRTLASASRDRTARLWDVRDLAHPRPWGPALTGHRGYVFSVSFSGNGRMLATASYDHTVRRWDVSNPARARPVGKPLTGHTDSVASAAFSPDGRTVASAGHDRTIRLWKAAGARPTLWAPPLTGFTSTVYAVSFSPDSRTLASVGDDRTVRLWNVSDPARPQPIGQPLTGHTSTLLAVAFSPDGRILATGGADHTIRLWDVSDPAHAAPLGRPLVGHTGFVNWVAFSPDGRSLASASDDHTVRLWNLPDTALIGHTDTVNALSYRPDGKILASASSDGTVRLWDVSDPIHPRPAAPVLAVPTGATRTAFGADGRLLAALGNDGKIRLWNVGDPAHPQPYPPIHAGRPDSADALALSPHGALLAAGGPGYWLRLWDLRDPAAPVPVGPSFDAGISPVTWAAFDPDGRTLAATSFDDKVRRWDVRDPAHPRPLPLIATGDTGGLLGAAFSPTGHVLATAGVGHAVQLWDVGGLARPVELGQPLTGHTEAVTSVTFSPDGGTLAAASDDGTIRLWNVTDLHHVTPVRTPATAGHTGPIGAITYSPDGSTLASAGTDRAVQLSVRNLNRAMRRVCATTRDNLTPQQWRIYLPEAHFRPLC